MNHLLKIGLDQEFIDKLIEKEGFASVDALNNNYDNFSRILTLITKLGVEDTNEFILLNTGVFYQKAEKIMNLIQNSNIEVLLNNIKKDNNYLADYILSNI